MQLATIADQLGWPAPMQITAPIGAGPRHLAELVRRKIEAPLRRRPGGGGLQTGILVQDASVGSSVPAIAIICEFPRPITADLLEEAHRLAWNFSRVPLLIIITPDLIRAWSCYYPPSFQRGLLSHDAEFISEPIAPDSVSAKVIENLEWINLISGTFYDRFPRLFNREGRADHQLLKNLKGARQALLSNDNGRLPAEIANSLLARLMFIQLLFDRTDQAGHSALNAAKLAELHESKILSQPHLSLADILGVREDAFSFFRWLDQIFNGDLFPGKGLDPVERREAWAIEEAVISEDHLRLLAHFIEAREDFATKQLSLWPLYRFDALPLEFISSIYEEFTSKARGVHYTPPHLVDFLLDAVLPWSGDEWNLRILDPACGSGIFLVKAYQRLIFRWRNANPGKDPPVELLQDMLENQIFGVDLDAEAVRVASFSLYLALCDEIDPRHYWDRVRFPALRGKSLLACDFFVEDATDCLPRNAVGVINTESAAATFDIVAGNAPWAANSLTDHGRKWAAAYGWPTPNDDQGVLFLAKAAKLTRTEGRIVLLQSAGALLYNSTATELREKLLGETRVEEIVNFSLVRDRLFRNSRLPTCSVVVRPAEPAEFLTYICPKPSRSGKENYDIIIDPHDVHTISVSEAMRDPLIWTVFLWGGRRDLDLVRRLAAMSSLAKLERSKPEDKDKPIFSREGIIPRTADQTYEQYDAVLQRPLLEELPRGAFLRINPELLGKNENARVQRRTSMRAFEAPQLLIKQGFQKQTGRFQAVLNLEGKGIVCTQSFISVNAKPEYHNALEAAWLALNSRIGMYYLLLTSRVGYYRSETRKEEIMEVPIPDPRAGLLDQVSNLRDVDDLAWAAYRLKLSERILVEDLTITGLPLSLREETGSSTHPQLPVSVTDIELAEYCRTFMRVLSAGFTHDQPLGASVLANGHRSTSAMRGVVIYLEAPGFSGVRIEPELSPSLWDQIARSESFTARTNNGYRIAYGRVARVYTILQVDGRPIPSVIILKPHEQRYWTRSLALGDADAVAAEALSWSAERNAPMLGAA
jgi:hypothetical protein